MTITSHGLTVKAYYCSECGAKSGREIDIEICQTKHKLKGLLMKACGMDWQKMRGFDVVSEPAMQQTGRHRAKKLRGAHTEEEARRRQQKYLAKKKAGNG